MSEYKFKTFKFKTKDCPVGYATEIQTIEQRVSALKAIPTPALKQDKEYLTIVSETTLPTTAARFYEFFMTTPGNKLVPGTKQVPEITGCLAITEDWGKPGCRRILQDANGDDAMDELLSVSPTCVEYMGHNFTGQGRKVMAHVHGKIQLEDTGENSVKITWTYRVATIGWIGQMVGKWIMLGVLKTFHQDAFAYWTKNFSS
jgi:hypothetical protein